MYFEGAYLNRGVIFAKASMFVQAIGDFNKAIELNPSFREAYLNRAVTYYQLKEYDKAWGDVRKAEGLGVVVNSKFISVLKEASGKDK
jgi:tetratricopeptide (TPR) repeat protein